MTLGELIAWYRPRLEDETVGVRRSWEEMFTYTTRQYPPTTPLEIFDVDTLSERLASSGMDQRIVGGYAKRWLGIIDAFAEERGEW